MFTSNFITSKIKVADRFPIPSLVWRLNSGLPSSLLTMKFQESNYIGKKFGRLTVIEFSHTKGYNKYFRCICDCGKNKTIILKTLLSGESKSCGCLSLEMTIERSTTHGMSYTSEYRSWAGMLVRCFNKNCKAYDRYGGRGITVCERWRNSFQNFYDDMGRKPKGYSIERKDNNGIYSPENCKWSSVQDQARNRRSNIKITYNGETICLAEYAEKIGVDFFVLYRKLKRGEVIC